MHNRSERQRMANPRKAYPIDPGLIPLYARAGDTPLLIQVSLDTAADSTWEREVRALQDAAAAHPQAEAVLITLDPVPPRS